MATGPSHYCEAERLLGIARESENAPIAVAQILAEAQIHATLALAAATALNTPGGEDSGMWTADVEQWEAAASAHKPKG